MFKINRLIHMQEGPAHVFSRANPWQTPGWPTPVRLDAMPYSELGMTRYNPWIGQTWQTARFWAKAGWPVRRYGWVDSTVTWDGAFRLNGQAWTPDEDDEYAEDWMIGGNAEVGGGDPGVDPFLILETRVDTRLLEVRCKVSKGDYPTVTFKVANQEKTVAMGEWASFSVAGKVTVTAISKDLLEMTTVDVPIFPKPESPLWARGEGPVYVEDIRGGEQYRHVGTLKTFSLLDNPPLWVQGYRQNPSGVTEVSLDLSEIFQEGNLVPFAIMSQFQSRSNHYSTGIALPDVDRGFTVKRFVVYVEDDRYEYNVGKKGWFGDFVGDTRVTVGSCSTAYGLPYPQPIMFEKYKNLEVVRWQLELHV